MYKNVNPNIGLGASVRRQLDRLASSLDPIVKEIAQLSKIDLHATIPASIPDTETLYDKILLFNALLITSHPRIAEEIIRIRKNMGLYQLLKYTKEFSEEDEQFSNTTFVGLDNSVKENIKNSLNIFFADVGRNLLREEWTDAISTYIITGTLPLPFQPWDTFEIGRTQNKTEQEESAEYPIIIIKKRIKKGELNPLIEFIKENSSELVKATKHLPSEPVKRFDVDVTKLAIGLWVYRNESLGIEEMEKWIKDNYAKNASYFGKHEGIGKESFPGYKSGALGYLNQLYPL